MTKKDAVCSVTRAARACSPVGTPHVEQMVQIAHGLVPSDVAPHYAIAALYAMHGTQHLSEHFV